MRAVKLQLVVCLVLSMALHASGGSTIDSTDKWAWASSGWINCLPNTTNGAVIGEYVCSGYFWSAGAGWINLGNGNPTNKIRYTNASSNDFGVNHDGKGNLRGYAWCPSSGWINFEDTGAPKVDLKSGNLSGYAWGGSLGWISFTNVSGHAETVTLYSGTNTDSDGLPDAWEYTYTNTLSVFSSSADFDQDGFTDGDEYAAATDPRSASSFLCITSIGSTNGTNMITWTCDPTRIYQVETNLFLTNSAGWGDCGYGMIVTNSSSNATIQLPIIPLDSCFYRIKVSVPGLFP